jgi:integrase
MEGVSLWELMARAENAMAARGASPGRIQGLRHQWRVFARWYPPGSRRMFSVLMARRFVAYQRRRCQAGEIRPATVRGYQRAVRLLIDAATPAEGGLRGVVFGPRGRDRRRRSGVKAPAGESRELAEAFGGWLKSLGFAASSVQGYGLAARKFLRWAGRRRLQLKDTRAGDILEFLGSGELAAWLAPDLSALRLFFGFAFEAGAMTADFSDCLPRLPGRPSRATEPLSREEEAQLLDGFDRSAPLGARDLAMVLLALRTGLRESDIKALRLRDLDLRSGAVSLVQAKTGRALTLPLPPDASRVLASYIADHRPPCRDDHLFVTRWGAPLAGLHRISRAALDRAGVRLGQPKRGFHLYRFTFTARLVAAGVPINLVSDMLGHRGKDSTRPYLALDGPALRRCALPLSDIGVGRDIL